MERKIGKFETAPAVANDYACFNLVGVLKLENPPAEEVIQKALGILQKHHPALRSRIAKSGRSYAFQGVDIPSIPLRVVERGDENQWIPAVEMFLNEPLDWRTGPLMNCLFLKNPDSNGVSELIFSFHHSIVDAISLITFFEDFLSICASHQIGNPVSGHEGYPALPAVEEMFPASYKGVSMALRTVRFMMRMLASEFSIMRKTRGMRTPPIYVHSLGRVLTMELNEEETQALERKVRKNKVTLSSVQHAAILTATWKHLYNNENRPLKYILFQNLRPYLDPPLNEEVLGSYIAMIQLMINMNVDREFWDICREINESVYQTGKSGDKFISANMSGTLLQMLFRYRTFRMAVTAMNYSGAIPLQKTYGDIHVVGVRGFASNFGLGPEFSAQTLIFNGKLIWNILYLETDMNADTAQQITDEIKDILVSKAQEE